MNINLSLLGQIITFSLLIAFTMKYIWPPLMKALQERRQKIADGLEAAERAQHERELAEQKAVTQIRQAKAKGAELLADAEHRASQLIDASKDKAKQEAKRILELAKAEIDQERQKTKAGLQKEVVDVALLAAQKLLQKQMGAEDHKRLVEQFIAEV